jgi:polar amino acid transport system substrate-binding protein
LAGRRHRDRTARSSADPADGAAGLSIGRTLSYSSGMTKRIARTLTAAALAIALSGCAAGGDKTEAAGGAKVIKKGTLTVCTHLPYKPFQYNQGGKVIGFDVDMMDLVAKKLKLKQSIFDTPFEGIESGQSLNTGKCDVAAAGMTITADRKKVLDFSKPYFNATQAMLVKKGSPIKSLDDLAGKSVGVQLGTTGAEYVRKNAPKTAKIKEFEDLALLTTAVKTGQTDAGVNDNGVLFDYAKTNPDTEVATEFDTGEQYGFAVAKGQNDKLLATIDSIITESKKNGQYDKIYKKYFGEAPGQ